MSSWEANSLRGYTDFLTGITKLLDVPSDTLIKYILKGRLPRPFLPSFLHEATHFWCMTSDLGVTLALLEMRAHHEIILEAPDHDSLLHDLGTIKITQQLLVPLLEGMALFQEFDAFPGNSRVISTPAMWAACLFQPLEEDPPQLSDLEELSEWMTNKIMDTLVQYRTSETALHRKINVLMSSISKDPHHYLTGYLSVKQIWLSAVGNTPAFLDRDLFMCFLREWIFQDWQLIDYLLDPDLDCSEVARLASKRIQTRLDQLATTTLAEEVAVYEHETNSKQPDTAQLLWSLHISERVAQQGQERFNLLLNKFMMEINGGDRDENLYIDDMCTLLHRQEMMRLSLEPVEIEVNEYDRLIVRKKASIERKSGSIEEFMDTYLAASAPEKSERGVTPGWMTMYFLPKSLGVVALAVRENQSMISIQSQSIPNDDLELLQSAATRFVPNKFCRGELTRIGHQLVDELDDLGYRITLERLPNHVRKVYTRYALNSVPEDKLAEVEAMLSQKGLYQVLDRNGDLLNAFVKLSLATSSITPSLHISYREFLSEMIAHDGFTIDSLLSQLYQQQQETGMPLLVRVDDVTWYFLV
jgi:hypothetical protein